MAFAASVTVSRFPFEGMLTHRAGCRKLYHSRLHTAIVPSLHPSTTIHYCLLHHVDLLLDASVCLTCGSHLVVAPPKERGRSSRPLIAEKKELISSCRLFRRGRRGRGPLPVLHRSRGCR